MSGMLGMQGIRVGMWGMGVGIGGMRGMTRMGAIRMGMRVSWVGMRGIRVRMQGIAVGKTKVRVRE